PRSAVSALCAAALALGSLVAVTEIKAKEPRRDPDNKKGISPYMEMIVKGQAAFSARDIQGAITTFQDAIKLRPEEMLGFYRLGEAEQEAGKLDDADKAWEAALSKRCSQGCEAPSNPDALKAKVMFNIAFLRERQQKWPAAKDAWESYAAFLKGNPKANG